MNKDAASIAKNLGIENDIPEEVKAKLDITDVDLKSVERSEYLAAL